MTDLPPGVAQLRLATYNIHRCIGRDGRFEPERIVRVLCELSADVVALQEVESGGGGSQVLAYLASCTGLAAVPGPTLWRATGEYGNALLTSASLLDVERIDLSVGNREPRGALNALLAAHGKRIRVLATHLGLRPTERRHQVRALLAHLDPTDTDTIVLMGDLNEWFLWGRPLRWLHRFFDETNALKTFPAQLPLFALDRLWVKPSDRLRHLSAHSSPMSRLASDHLPLLAVIEP